MIRSISQNQTATLSASAHALPGEPSDYDALMERIGDAPLVLIGEASHGTHDFYYERAEITKRLIAEKGFTAVAVEADWPDADRVNRFVRGVSDDQSGEAALSNFRRFPTWMWRNTDVLRFLAWLQDYNQSRSSAQRAGFYGLDLYSMYSSIEAVIDYLDSVDPEAAQRARRRYSCFEHFGEDSQRYGYSAALDISQSCEDEAVNQLLELQQRIAEYAERDGRVSEDAHFYAEQNARLVKNAEEYYRSMFRGRASSWNLRDRHMTQTLNELMAYLGRSHRPQKVVVWAHNSHLGDASATEMGDRGELNVGQLVRSQYGQDAVLIGFSTYTGTVAAATNWGGTVEMKRVRPALPESYEALFYDCDPHRFYLLLGEDEAVTQVLKTPRLQRAIGVIYRPETERVSHYFDARLPDQFDAIIHIDSSRAVEPLDLIQPPTGEPATFPSKV
jgi:erythromycin esterase-like protein